MTAASGAHRTSRLLALSGAAALGLSATAAAPAWAHDTLISSVPEEGEVLTESPEEIVLEFSGSGLTQGEDIPNEILVRDEDGESWETEESAVVEGSTMSTDLQDSLPNGEYTVTYHVVYSDGHDEELSFEFEVEDPAAIDSSEAQADEDEAEEPSQQERAEAETPDMAGPAAEEDPAAQDTAAQDENPAVQDDFPAWAPIVFAGAGVLVVATVLVLVRQKMKQAEKWKDHSSDDDVSGEGDRDSQ